MIDQRQKRTEWGFYQWQIYRHVDGRYSVRGYDKGNRNWQPDGPTLNFQNIKEVLTHIERVEDRKTPINRKLNNILKGK